MRTKLSPERGAPVKKAVPQKKPSRKPATKKTANLPAKKETPPDDKLTTTDFFQCGLAFAGHMVAAAGDKKLTVGELLDGLNGIAEGLNLRDKPVVKW
jgi:hypothetical protein